MPTYPPNPTSPYSSSRLPFERLRCPIYNLERRKKSISQCPENEPRKKAKRRKRANPFQITIAR
jgi:hypothetical protein